MNDLEFNEERHEYKWKGVIVPSVTQILQSEGLIDYSDVQNELLEASAELGRKVHSITAQYDNYHSMNYSYISPVLKNYLDAWVKFKTKYMFKPLIIEVPMFHTLYRYAGTPDRIGIIEDNEKYSRNKFVLVDIKTGQKHISHSIQTAAYTAMYNYKKIPSEQIKRRLAVYLFSDGTYKVEEHKEKSDFDIFLSALTMYNFKKQHSLLTIK